MVFTQFGHFLKHSFLFENQRVLIVKTIVHSFIFLTMQHGMWNLSSQTREQTHSRCRESLECNFQGGSVLSLNVVMNFPRMALQGPSSPQSDPWRREAGWGGTSHLCGQSLF